ncbi:hypothetical protein BC830DRAFT_187886 [Chytriomyces sp. MP71]|nr:hypothetical protein BC830DRAFT_187886 [Chytriomyces sp. MP71]
MLISKVGGLLLFLFRLSCSAPSHDLHTVALARRSVDANGNGVTFPTTAIPLTMGKSYVCTFVTGSQISWDTISVDLYNVAVRSKLLYRKSCQDRSF